MHTFKQIRSKMKEDSNSSSHKALLQLDKGLASISKN